MSEDSPNSTCIGHCTIGSTALPTPGASAHLIHEFPLVLEGLETAPLSPASSPTEFRLPYANGPPTFA